VSEDETRYFMNGIYFDSNNIVSTDGRRLIYTENTTVNRNCIVSCFRCRKLWTQAKEIYIGLKCTKLVFSDCEFYVEHVEGQFPPYNKVIPEFSDNYIVTIPGKKELEYFLKKAKVIDSKDPDIRYQLTNTKNESEFVFFNVKFLLDIEKFGINTLYGQDNKKAYTGKHEDMNIVIMPMREV
jgi:DNA polymerase III sliding clamp (beta) subunit (PCNA family)